MMSHLLTTKSTKRSTPPSPKRAGTSAPRVRKKKNRQRPRSGSGRPPSKAGSKIEGGLLRTDLDARRPADGLAALHLACIRGSDGAVATLLRAGAAVTAEDASGRTALHAAAASDRANCCFALQKWGGREFAIDAVDRDGRHALSLSAESGAARSAEELLRMGSDVHLRDKAGRTAFALRLHRRQRASRPYW